MEALLARLTKMERHLKSDAKMRISEEEATNVVKHFIQSAEVRDIITQNTSEVSVVPVHTYVHQLSKDPGCGTSTSIVIPSFASHWGVVVGPPNEQMLFHLVFAESDHSERKSSTVPNSKIRFHATEMLKPVPNAKHVGVTRYSTDELRKLGKAMINAFGNYHRIFWNCQTFAKCYLRVITGDIQADFADWTAGDTTRLFMCAFLIGAPFATTTKIKERTRTQELVKQFDDIPPAGDLWERSDFAISAVYDALKNDPSWGEGVELADETHQPGFVEKVFRLLFKKNQV